MDESATCLVGFAKTGGTLFAAKTVTQPQPVTQGINFGWDAGEDGGGGGLKWSRAAWREGWG